MEFVAPVATSVFESLMAPVKKHMDFFFSSTKHVTNMSEKLSELIVTKHDVEQKKEDASINDRLIPDRVPGWLEQVEAITKRARDILTSENGCLNPMNRYKAGKKSFYIVMKIDKLLEKQKEIEWTDKQRPLGKVIIHTGPSTSETVPDYCVTQNNFPSRISIFDDLLKSLEPHNKTQRMAIWGMGGVGKTTMMEDIKKVVERRGMFDYVLKVDIGRKYDPLTIQRCIANRMGEPLTEETVKEGAERLEKRFEEMSKTDKRILFILDDVWEAIKLKDIGLTSPFPKGFKLLITSRNKMVCIKMDIATSSIFGMGRLEETEANDFFWETVSYSYVDDELRKIGKHIVKRCHGLPIAIKIIAEALKGEGRVAWETAQNSLQRHNRNVVEELEEVVYTTFEISYNYLKKDDDKAIFVLCGLFPDDSDISIEELVRYGWGLQLFNKAGSLEEARNQTNWSVTTLIQVNLLNDSSTIGCVKMHDFARAFILSNISQFKQASIVNHGDKSEWPTQDKRESCERVLLACEGMSKFPQDFCYPNLALLKLMNGDKVLKFSDNFNMRMEKLEVVSFDNMQNTLHPVSLQCFIGLRTLCLHSCILVDNDISFLGDLVSLEVLSISYCHIQKLPSAIRKLKRLRLLDLTGCAGLCIDDGVFLNLDNLEELYMRSYIFNPIKFTNANYEELGILSRRLYALEVEFYKYICEMKSMSFTKLQRFRISMGCLLREVTDKLIDEYCSYNTLKLVTNISDLLKCKINELYSKTEKLHLSVKDMSCVEDIAMFPSQHSTFCKLKFLHVFKCADLTHLFTSPVANGLKQLRSLTVSSCPVLKSLVTFFPGVNIIELPELVELKLYNLPNFTSIFLENNISSSSTQSLFNKEVVFPKLSKLTVYSLKKLKQLWACETTSGEEDSVSMLREIVVSYCDCLVNLFPKNPMRLLSQLEKLKVANCSSIKVLFNIELGEIEQLRNTGNLRKIEVFELDELTEVWRINEENSSWHLIRAFRAVETINIKKCKKFRNVFTPTTANLDIGALKEISITIHSGEEVEITGISKPQEISKVVLPYYHLRKIYFRGGVSDVMFEMGCQSINRELVTTQQHQPIPILPYLQELELWYMDTMSHVWKCSNWNEFFILHNHQPQSSFQNLTTIKLWYCKSIKYLFSPLMSKLLLSLKTITIIDCQGMEEVVSNRDDDDDEVLVASTTTLFPCLDNVHLSYLSNLKHIDGDFAKHSNEGVVSWSLCQSAKKMCIQDCHALTSVIPSYAALQMQKLQELSIEGCSSIVEVFETKEINIYGCSSSSSIIDQRNTPLPRPKNITMHHELSNLKMVYFSECYLLEYVFTFSTLDSLKKLENISIRDCKAMKVIVREENRDNSSKVVLPRLKSIELADLPNLVGFHLGLNNDIQFPSLDHVMIEECPQMMAFTPTASKLKYIHTSLGKHNLECCLHQTPSPTSNSSCLCPALAKGTSFSFHNLVELVLKVNWDVKKVVPFNELLHLQNLEKIYLHGCVCVKEVFEVPSEVTNIELETVVKFPKLREVKIINLDNLKCIWMSNPWITLVFPNLTRLYIFGCQTLKYVFTPSMVGSLMQLEELDIILCSGMEVIVKKEEECDGKVSEIILPCLRSLKLERLWKLQGFCLGKDNFTLPSLNTLVIKACPEITIFSEGRAIAPKLNLVEASFGSYNASEDINSFIMTKKQEGNIFGCSF